MTKLKEFDELLSDTAGITTDSWYDYMEDNAVSKTKDFNDSDWKELSNLWKTKPEDWQIRLAEVLGSSNLSKTAPVLEDMVREAIPSVAAEALNSLSGIDDDGNCYIPNDDMLQLMEKIYADSSNQYVKMSIESIRSNAEKNNS